MTDLGTISAALGSIKAASDIAKIIKNSGASLEQAELKLKFADLISNLADAKIDLADIQVLLLEKEEKIRELDKTLKTKRSVIWEKPYYFTNDNNKKDGPYCQQCYDNNEKLIRLQGGGKSPWNCLTCNKKYKDANYVRPTYNIKY